MPQKNQSKSGTSKRRKKPIKNRWYIVSLVSKSQNGKYRLLGKNFKTKKEARRAIKNNFPGKELYYETLTGEDARFYGFRFIPYTSIQTPLSKYPYPPELDPGQPRKSFRTKYRRWKRTFKRELKNVYSANV